MNLCVIPARKGSKRIPGKNTNMFLGKPIIQYVLSAAIQSERFDKIIISSDNEELKNQYAEFYEQRSEYNCGDFATLSDVVDEVLAKYAEYENICMVLPTAVFISPDIIRKTFKLLQYGSGVVTTSRIHPNMYVDAGQLYWLKVGAYKNATGSKILRTANISYVIDAVDINTKEDWKLAEGIYESARGSVVG